MSWRDSRGAARKRDFSVPLGPSLRVIDNPKAVRLLGYEDYRRFFMPLAREEMAARAAAGDNLSPSPEHWARIQAGYHASEALMRPHVAAANAIAFCARCVAHELGEDE